VSLKIAGFLAAPGLWLSLLGLFLAAKSAARDQQITVSAHVQLVGNGQDRSAVPSNGGVVVWLKPLDTPAHDLSPTPKRQKLVQIHKAFEPHLLIVQVGSTVDFPNHDPFLHNVFSLFEGKRFDLGLYEAGASNSVRFDRVGFSFLFCNIHPEMSAVVVALDTPYFGVSDASGKVSIANVPEGRYEVHYWSERGLPDALKQLTRTVTISGSEGRLIPVKIVENPDFTTSHKNKYGQDYAPPPTTDYPRP
jgi:plastocyanin